ncbi:MAG: hypothetical protein ACK5PI_06245 [Acetobacteraceae bacterium]
MSLPEMDAGLIRLLADAPMLGLLIWLLFLLHRDLPDRRARPAEPHGPPDALARTRDDLAAFKIEVARTYVPLSLIRDGDARLSSQLMRIEQTLDEVSRAATATEAVMRTARAEDR